MADYSIAAVTRRAVYTGSAGTGPYAFTFALLATSDLAVYKNATKLTETSDYTVTLSSSTGQGSVTLASAASGSDTITLVGARALARTTDFVTSGSLTAAALNTDLDSLVIFAQQLSEENSRNMKAPVTEGISGTTDMTLPAKADRLGKILQFNSSTGNPEVTTFTLSGVTATDTELNILDGATLSTAELNILDGVTSTTAELNILDGVTSTAAELNLLDGITAIADEDDMSSNSATKLATQQSIKAYVDAQIATEDTLAELNDTNITSPADASLLFYDTATSKWIDNVISGDATVADTGVLTIANNAVETAMINADAVTGAKIADDAIDSEHYTDGSIDTAHIGDLQVTTAKIAADAITGAKLADDALDSEHYTDGSIDTAHIADLQVTTAKIAADAITSAKIADDAISEEHLDPTVISGLADTTIASGDHLMFFDATDSQLKKVDAAELGVGSALTEVVGDTSPQLGGTLDANGNAIDMNGLADGIILDTDADTTISAPTDDQIDIEIGGADDFRFTANTFTALSGSDIVHADSGSVRNRPNAQPLIINGDMAVAQRGTSVTGVTGVGYNAIDRMKTLLGDNGTWTHTQDTDVPTGQGFANSWKLDNTTADTSVASGAFHTASYFFEGQDLQLLKKGTSSAEKVTISFWIKTTVTGTYIAELYDGDNTRQISQAYTVSSSNTWEKKVLSFAGDTTGALDDDNANSLILNLWLGAGSDYTSGTLNTSWGSVTTANRAVGQVNGASSTSNNIYITGLQMEVGEYTSTTLPPFQHESFGDNLIRCQRYFQKYSQPPLIGSANANNTIARASFGLVNSMRTGATATHNGTFSWFYSNSHQPTSTAFSATYTDENTFEADVTVSGTSMTATHPCSVFQSGTASLDLDAEL